MILLNHEIKHKELRHSHKHKNYPRYMIISHVTSNNNHIIITCFRNYNMPWSRNLVLRTIFRKHKKSLFSKKSLSVFSKNKSGKNFANAHCKCFRNSPQIVFSINNLSKKQYLQKISQTLKLSIFESFICLCSRKKWVGMRFLRNPIEQVFSKRISKCFRENKRYFRKYETLKDFSQTLVKCVLERIPPSQVIAKTVISKEFLYKNFETVSTYVSFAMKFFQRLNPVKMKEKQAINPQKWHKFTNFEKKL